VSGDLVWLELGVRRAPEAELEAYGPTSHVTERALFHAYRNAGGRSCRDCGCTDAFGCPGPGSCWWVEPDLCSSCFEQRAAPIG